MIYFIQAGKHGPIKIGVAQDIEARLATLQTGCPDELRVVGKFFMEPDEEYAEEKALHRQFADLHIRGEWFRPDEPLLQFIQQEGNPPRAKCPFCHVANVTLTSMEYRDDRYQAVCLGCGARGPERKTHWAAIHAWNNRKE